jgi:HlyD family secretion protein
MKSAELRRGLFWLPIVGVLALGIVWLFQPSPIAVDIATAQRAPMQVMVTDEGVTQVKEVFVVSAPVGGLMRRIDLEPGDAVVAKETVVATIEPSDPGFLDVRTEAERNALVRAAAAAKTLAAAEVTRAQAELEFARRELERARDLKALDTISRSAFEETERRARTSAASLDEAKANLSMREFELERARASLIDTSAARGNRLECDCVEVVAPVSGQVLRVLQRSEGVIASGTTLVEIGDPRELEVMVELHSYDAVNVDPGNRVMIEAWGGEMPLTGTVARVEPTGFTKTSALGVEEQRVRVIIELTGAAEQWQKLGHGYRVEPSIVIWSGDSVLQLPVSAFFRVGDHWAVFVTEDGQARRRLVRLGQNNGRSVQILEGLQAGEQVILHPSDSIEDGVLIERRG